MNKKLFFITTLLFTINIYCSENKKPSCENKKPKELSFEQQLDAFCKEFDEAESESTKRTVVMKVALFGQRYNSLYLLSQLPKDKKNMDNCFKTARGFLQKIDPFSQSL